MKLQGEGRKSSRSSRVYTVHEQRRGSKRRQLTGSPSLISSSFSRFGRVTFRSRRTPYSETAIRVSSAVRIPPHPYPLFSSLYREIRPFLLHRTKIHPLDFSLSPPPRVIPFVYDLVPPTFRFAINEPKRSR